MKTMRCVLDFSKQDLLRSIVVYFNFYEVEFYSLNSQNLESGLYNVIAEFLQHRDTESQLKKITPSQYAVKLPPSERSKVPDFIDTLKQHLYASLGNYLPFCYGVAEVECGENNELWHENAKLAAIYAQRKGDSSAVYSAQLHDDMKLTIMLRNAAARAIENDTFYFHIQPIVDAKANKIEGAEVLLRLDDDNGAMIPIGSLIDAIESTELITNLTLYLVDKVFREVIQNVTNSEIYISINIPSSLIRNRNFVNYFVATLNRYAPIVPTIQLEITEGSMIESSRLVVENLNVLRACGVRVALDDFGTGYSCLSLLHDLPIDSVKIDRSFIKMSDSPKVRIILSSLAIVLKQLGISTIIEGVETSEQLRLCQRFSYFSIQGYWYYKPMPVIEFMKLI